MSDPYEHVRSISRPHPNLLKYYLLSSIAFGPALPFVLVYRLFRYKTLHYQIDDEGVTMSWGMFFRREISLTYARIQDIHLVSNIVERWMGLARVQIQTAAGSATAEMTLEGLLEFELVRDFLYSRMRGARKLAKPEPPPQPAEEAVTSQAVEALREATAELRALRQELAARSAGEAP